MWREPRWEEPEQDATSRCSGSVTGVSLRCLPSPWVLGMSSPGSKGCPNCASRLPGELPETLPFTQAWVSEAGAAGRKLGPEHRWSRHLGAGGEGGRTKKEGSRTLGIYLVLPPSGLRRGRPSGEASCVDGGVNRRKELNSQGLGVPGREGAGP